MNWSTQCYCQERNDETLNESQAAGPKVPGDQSPHREEDKEEEEDTGLFLIKSIGEQEHLILCWLETD